MEKAGKDKKSQRKPSEKQIRGFEQRKINPLDFRPSLS